MRRRLFLTALGAGTASALAGCSALETSESDNTGNDDEMTMEEELLERARNEVVEDGQFAYTPNLYLLEIEDLSTDTLTAKLNVSYNPVSDYDINVHITPITAENHGEWNFVVPRSEPYGRPPEYDEETEEWIGDSPSARLEYVVEEGADEPAGSVTIPKEAFEDPRESPGGVDAEDDTTIGSLGHRDPYGVPITLDFDLEKEPPMYEPFVLTFTWSGGDILSDREGEVITSSQQVMRTDAGWLYPRQQDRRDVLNHPDWYGNSVDDWDGYETGDLYQNVFETNDDTTTANVVRLSHYGRWSEKPSELASEGNRKDDNRDYSTTGAGEFIGTTRPDYSNAPLNNLWSVDYEITESKVEEAKSVAASQKPQTGNELADVYEMMHSSEVVNHEIVQDIAQQLGDVCEAMDATAPTEQLRVVADFVQYFDYAYFENHTNAPTGNYSIARGTAHPVETLERGYGDCKDYTVLMNALIQQKPFNLTPQAGVFDNIDGFTDDIDGHVSTGVPLEELEIEGIVDDDIFGESALDFNECQFTYDGDPYMYIETSIPYPMGYIYDHPEYDDASGIDNYV